MPHHKTSFLKRLKQQAVLIYASEADVLNIASIGITAKQWRDQYLDEFKQVIDVITANRHSFTLRDVRAKVYKRDLFGSDI